MSDQPGTRASAWAPLRNAVFRSLWLAVLASNVGTWMQTVGAQWLLVAVLLLAFTFALGVGQAMTLPAWQAIIPELVPRSQIPSASALGSISVNLARSVGPAVAGLLIAQIGVAAVFGLNAVSYLVFAVALLRWRRPADGLDTDQERFGPALRAGGRYVRHSPVVRRILLRAILFVLPGSAVWSLLPLVASQRLRLGSGGYGLLLGVGAILGAVGLPRVRARLDDNRLLLLAGVAFAAAMAVMAVAVEPVVVLLALIPAGFAWMTVISSVNAAMQLFLPSWVRARGLSVYQIVFAGSQAVGAVLWGISAQVSSLSVVFGAAAVLMAAGATTVRRWPLHDVADVNRDAVAYWPEPHLSVDPHPDGGPVLVSARYRVTVGNRAAFVAAMQAVRRSRQRTGAVRWGLFRDGADPAAFVEVYLVPSWEEHLRQHSGRLTGSDEEHERRAVMLAEGPAEVVHLLLADSPDLP